MTLGVGLGTAPVVLHLLIPMQQLRTVALVKVGTGRPREPHGLAPCNEVQQDQSRPCLGLSRWALQGRP